MMANGLDLGKDVHLTNKMPFQDIDFKSH